MTENWLWPTGFKVFVITIFVGYLIFSYIRRVSWVRYTNHANISIRLSVYRNPALGGNLTTNCWATTRLQVSSRFVNVAMRV